MPSHHRSLSLAVSSASFLRSAAHLSSGLGGGGDGGGGGVTLSVCLWRMELPEGIPNRSPKSVKSLSETCKNCSLHSSTRTKCCCLLSLYLSISLSSFFDLSTLLPLLSLPLSVIPPQPQRPTPSPPPFHLSPSPFPESRICSCAHLNQSNKGCRFRLIKACVSACRTFAHTHTHTYTQMWAASSLLYYPSFLLILHHRIERKKATLPGFLL